MSRPKHLPDRRLSDSDFRALLETAPDCYLILLADPDYTRAYAGRGLIHQQQLRVLREQHPDLQPLLLSVRE